MAKEKLINILRQGAKVWNKWREENPDVKPDFRGANLSRKNFNDIPARAATLGTRLPTGPYPLIEANLSNVDLSGANLRGADLTETNLQEADLTGAQLCYAHLVGTKLENATLTGCHIYGISTWDLKLKRAVQSNLIITPPGEPTITVDNLEVAQFIYLLLQSEKIRDVINTIGKKGVLILGRFTPGERKTVLEAIREKLRQLDFVPIVFDFERPTDRDFTETIKTLAGMSCFIIADITNPKSSPLELQATVPDYMIPFVPIIQKGENPFAMFKDLANKYDWVLKPLNYDSVPNLMKGFKKGIIEPALEMQDQLKAKKAEELSIRNIEDYIDELDE